MNPIERLIRLVLENVPTVMFVLALICATWFSAIPGWADRYLTWFLFLPVGVQGIWAGVTHTMFQETGAKYIGWEPSPFQLEIGVADLAIGAVALVSFWQGLEFKGALVLYLVIFYVGVALVHVRDARQRGNMAKGNFGGLLVMTLVKAVGLPVLWYLAWQAQAVA